MLKRTELLKTAKPILFNTEMVRAVLDGRKTVTRRVVKPRYRADEGGFQVITTRSGEFVRVEKVDENECGIFSDGTERYVNPAYNVGDILYVRETWCTDDDMVDVFEESLTHGIYYRANEINNNWVDDKEIVKWKPSIHMPKEVARIFLKITDVRCERLQDITEEQTLKEGVRSERSKCIYYKTSECEECANQHESYYDFVDTWNSTIKKQDLDLYSWNANPWVWVYEFEVIQVD